MKPTHDQLQRRRGRALTALAQLQGDVLYVGSLVNVRYLTGFTGSNGALLLAADGTATLLTDGRYRDQAAAEVDAVDVHITRDLLGVVLDGACSGAVAIESHVMTVDDYHRLDHAEIRTIGSQRLVERLRVVKDDAELASLTLACEISTQAFEDLLAEPLAGQTERQVARRLELAMIERGAEAIGFETIVASGPNGAIPHHQPGPRIIGEGDLITIDFGARVDGYHADCTRTVVVGSADRWQREVHAAVQRAQALGVARLTEGSAPSAIDAAVRSDLQESGWLDQFTTGLGHGVGLQIHEDPFFGPRSTDRLARNTVLTMEPGVYVPGRGGVRIEDTVHVTPAGPVVLTPLPTDLLEIA